MLPAESEAHSRAIELHHAGQTPVAIELLGQAIKGSPYSGELLVLRAILLHSEQAWAAALSDAETAMLLMPLPVGGELVLADCYWQVGQKELALVGYEHLLERGPLTAAVYAGVYTGLRRCGRHDLALRACRAAVELEPDNDAAYYGMAHCMASLRYAAAYVAGVLRRAVELNPDNVVYRASLAVQLLRDGKPSDAYAVLAELAAEELSAIDCHCSAKLIARLCSWAGDKRRAAVATEVCERLTAAAQAQDREDSRGGPSHDDAP
ncbi:MAG: hypothetical protein AAGJ46_03520 [Planctomycetota bacterium]